MMLDHYACARNVPRPSVVARVLRTIITAIGWTWTVLAITIVGLVVTMLTVSLMVRAIGSP
jgi:hypothetical protein